MHFNLFKIAPDAIPRVRQTSFSILACQTEIHGFHVMSFVLESTKPHDLRHVPNTLLVRAVSATSHYDSSQQCEKNVFFSCATASFMREETNYQAKVSTLGDNTFDDNSST